MDREPLDTTEVCAVIDAFEESDWQELRLMVGDMVVHVARSAEAVILVGAEGAPVGAARDAEAATARPASPGGVDRVVRPQPTASPKVSPATRTAVPEAAVPLSEDDDGAATVTVRSPTLGLFWRAPHPGAASFVEVGDPVEVDTTLCIVEVMKLMNSLKAGVRGVVTEVLADDGQVLERDQALFQLRLLEP
jgi:biotin carboxyl carrier protein